MITINSYFSGAGLLDIGINQAGLEIQQSFELDKRACETQRANFTHDVVRCDITKKLAFDEVSADVYLFTYPCTKYSTIADIHNTRTGDELYLHACRHVALKLPEIFVVENVMGMKKFEVVMEFLTKLPQYHVKIFEVNSNIWLPQNRERLIIFASRREFDFQAPTAPTKVVTLKDIVEKDPRYTMTGGITTRMNGGYRDLPIISDPSKGDIAPCAVAHYSKDKSTRLLKDNREELGVRPYSVREYARLQGVPDWFVFPCSDTEAYRQIGNGVSIDVGEWCGLQIKRYYGITTTSRRRRRRKNSLLLAA